MVQGVGFRPFVYNLALSLRLAGFVFNSSAGVTIEIEGAPAEIDAFLHALKNKPPQLAEITDVAVSDVPEKGETAFTILQSRPQEGEFVMVSPDAGTCDLCWRDFGNPANRRYGYPFTNCTHCGPRYTIVQDIPYDRATTTMSRFTMCRDCQAEYEDPADRRFHAQPNACSLCGPSLCLVPRGASLRECDFSAADSLSILHHARALLSQGRILAVKGLGGFLLACDAGNEQAVAELRLRKCRPAKPFALMARDMESVRNLCQLTPADQAALLHQRRPIVILPQRAGSGMAPGLAPGNNTLGVMLPYTPLHYLLFSDSPGEPSEFPALVMTSGNQSEEPIVVSNDDALTRLGHIADWFLLHNRDIAMRVDDSVVRCFEGRERVLRRSRGFVPQAIDLDAAMDEVLAYGAELKNTFCLTKGRYAFLSQHIGDLENYETMQFFEETLTNLKHMFRVAPRAVAYDLHPGYMSTRMALASPIERKIGVQHHHAHIASCMAENHLHGKVIGVALDGTGYGADGRIWGGEFLVAGYGEFNRCAHLRYVPLPGGDAAVRQPWRMALSYLHDAYGGQFPADLAGNLACFHRIGARQLELLRTMIERQFQTVETSSCGRLFDAVAALVGVGREVSFEGQAAIALEAIAETDPGKRLDRRYNFDLAFDPAETAVSEPVVLDFRPMVREIVADLAASRSPADISGSFHNTLSAAIGAVCSRIRDAAVRGGETIGDNQDLNRVCLSGGTFQNHYLLTRTVEDLRSRGFGVFLHTMVPANDGGIAFGQAAIANYLLQHERGG